MATTTGVDSANIVVKIEDVTFSIPPGALSSEALERLMNTAIHIKQGDDTSDTMTPAISVAESVRLGIESLDASLIVEETSEELPGQPEQLEQDSDIEDSEGECTAEYDAEVEAEIAALSSPLVSDLFPRYLVGIKHKMAKENEADWHSVKDFMDVIFPRDLTHLREWLEEVQGSQNEIIEGTAREKAAAYYDECQVQFLKSVAGSVHDGVWQAVGHLNNEMKHDEAAEPGMVIKLHLLLETFGDGVLAMLVANFGLEELAAAEYTVLKKILFKLEQRLSNVSVIFEELNEQVIKPMLTGEVVNHKIVV